MFTSESVSEGHPDKICDRISDMVVDTYLSVDPQARIACETLATTNKVILAGEVRGPSISSDQIISQVRDCIKDIGYEQEGFHWENCEIKSFLHEQSKDIAMGVDREDKAKQGAGDQGLMFGYAVNETKALMPATIQISHDLVKQHSEIRNNETIEWLRPDAKSQVTINYNKGKPSHINTVVLSTQHDDNIDMEEIHECVLEHIIKPILPDELVTGETRYLINPTGSFVIGGPVGDCGLTGRKIIVDTYGGMARHGGGAFSGKDPSKVDRSAAYAARYVAKNIVAAGLADRCEIQVSYAIGVAEPTSIRIKTFGTEKIQEKQIIQLVHDNFDLTPYGIMNMLDLLKPIYEKTAAYGHFGRENEEFPWEKIDKAADLKEQSGL